MEIKGEVDIEVQKAVLDPETLPLKMTIEELAEICCRKGIVVTIALQEKDNGQIA